MFSFRVEARGVPFSIWYPEGIMVDPDQIDPSNSKHIQALAEIIVYYKKNKAGFNLESMMGCGDEFYYFGSPEQMKDVTELYETVVREGCDISTDALAQAKKIRDVYYGFTPKPVRPPKARPEKSRHGFVYLLRSDTGYWKIGRTVNPASREKTFGVKLPFVVRFEHLIETNDMIALELRLHNHFSKKRVDGEWFDLSSEDTAYIKSL